MRKLAALAALVILAVVLQGTVMSTLAPVGIHADLPLVFCTMLALYLGPMPGFATALFAGLVQDVALGRPIGITPMPLVIVCYATGLLEHRVFKENPVIPAAVVFCASFCASLLARLFLPLIGADVALPLSSVSMHVADMSTSVLLYVPIQRFAKWLAGAPFRRV